jgi:hypothetical protein
MTVLDSRQRDVGRGIARFDLELYKDLGVKSGEVIGIAGKRLNFNPKPKH